MLKEAPFTNISTTPDPEAPTGVPNPELLKLNPALPVDDQIDQFMHDQGRADRNGLSYMQDGKLFVIRDSDEVREAGELDYAEVGPKFYVRHRVIHLGDRQKVASPTTITVKKHTVDEYSPDGTTLFKVHHVDDETLGASLQELGSGGGELWFQEEQPNTATGRKINVDAPVDRKLSVYDEAQKVRTANGLDDMSGLTWKHKGKTWMIRRQVVATRRTIDAWENVLQYEIVAKDGTDSTDKRVLDATDFKKMLDGYSDESRQRLGMHFEVPREPRQLHAARIGGQVVLERERRKIESANQSADPDVQPSDYRNLSIAERKALLQYSELDSGRSDVEKLKKSLLENPDFDDVVYHLGIISAELGKGKLGELALRMHSNYLHDLDALGLDPEPEDLSITPILWSLAQQRLAAFDPEYVVRNPELTGLEEGDAIGYMLSNRKKQSELIDRLVGSTLTKRVRPVTLTPHETPKEDGSTETVWRYKKNLSPPNEELLRRLPGKIDGKVSALLHHLTAEAPTLDYKEETTLGRVAREAIGR